MGYDVWARFDDPDKYGEGYADAIEEALRASGRERITFEDVQRRFKDYKNSETARENARCVLKKNPAKLPERLSHFADWLDSSEPPYTANLSSNDMIDFLFFFNAVKGKLDCDGSSNEFNGKKE